MSGWNLASILARHADRFGDRPCCLHLELAIRDDEDRPVPAGTLGEG